MTTVLLKGWGSVQLTMYSFVWVKERVLSITGLPELPLAKSSLS